MPVPSPVGSGAEAASKSARSANPRAAGPRPLRRAAEGVRQGVAHWSCPRNGQGSFGGRSDPLTRRSRLGHARHPGAGARGGPGGSERRERGEPQGRVIDFGGVWPGADRLIRARSV